MSIVTRTVCDSEGKIKAAKGTLCPASGNPYQFYAGIADINYEKVSSKTIVQLVMPLGGVESGLFRFPRVGEMVLIVQGDDTKYYLMGYLPGTAQPFSAAAGQEGANEKNITQKEVVDQQGQVFRYQQTGKKADKAESDAKYSEIGFYHKETAWKTGKPADYADVDGDTPPKIDYLNIQSTGDIRSKAQNYHEIKAKRLEILAGIPDSYDHTRDGDKFNWETTKLPLGDTPADDSHLYAGDAHIRANNRIVIKAGDEIVLQVGRSTVRITDAGITLSSNKVKGGFANPWNTVLSLTPRDGITMFGQHLNMTGAFDFSLRDNMGGRLSSMAGVVRMEGKDIKASTLTNIGYIGKQAALFGQLGICVDAMRSGMLKRLQGDLEGYDMARSGASSAIDKVVPLVCTVLGAVLGKDTDPEDSDPIDFYMTVLSMLLSINAASCGVLAESMRTKQQMRDDIRDQINMAQVVVEYGLILAAAVPLAVGPGFFTGLTHSAALHLRGSAEIVESGFQYNLTTLKQGKAFSPAAGYVHTALNKVKDFAKDHKMVFGIISAIAALSAGAIAVISYKVGDYSINNRWERTDAADQSALDALKEL